ncbi:hypothetical protein ABZ695_05695 [Streptomyces sp. NPDC006976]|uniref:hypothetical protein n=1 Tax=Streptomyces sp. NPDC006976 TaxID=3154311 RepID=UPI0033FEB83E
MTLRIDDWNVDFRPQGWIRLKEGEGGPTVYLQFEQFGPPGQERFDMQSVVMEKGSEDTLSGRTWRRVPFSELEMYLKIPEVMGYLTTPCDVTPPSLDSLAEYFDATAHLVSAKGTIPGRALAPDGSPQDSFPVVRPLEGRLTDEHLRDVAEAYRWNTNANRPPAPAIAEAAGVPVRTVHRWIYEARKRGILPPARTGRAG